MHRITAPRLKNPDASLAETLACHPTLDAHDHNVVPETCNRRSLLRGVAAAGLLLSPLHAFAATCSVIPSETAGPFPGDGSNGPNALAQSGIVRTDIRSSFGTAGEATAQGIPLTLTLQVVDAEAGCTALPGYAVYVWHCDASGRYSMYSGAVATQNFLRGVQFADDGGNVRFATIFPGCYGGRWPHIHFEIYPSAAAAMAGRKALKISQLALPAAACQAAYAGAGTVYRTSAANLAQMTLADDYVFRDGARGQVASVSGTNTEGYTATLQVGVAAANA